MKPKIGIIGAGISGISLAKILADKADVTVFEHKEKAGGLISCDRVEDVLYHRVGGHVFNSKNVAVLNWFWNHFNKDTEFIKANRFAKVFLNDMLINYPIEDHIYQLGADYATEIVTDFLSIVSEHKYTTESANFEDFLLSRFGKTLYKLYFEPYNRKIWNTDLKDVPLNWLDGKLPMPTIDKIINANILRREEGQMVHATFYYPVYGGSQFIIDRLSEGLNIKCKYKVEKIKSHGGVVSINDEYYFDKLIYTGDIRALPFVFQGNEGLNNLQEALSSLKSNGTTNVLCSCDKTELSWLYLPEVKYKAHRIIYTGGFSQTNNGGLPDSSCTVEFSNYVGIEEIEGELAKLPGNLKMISYNYEANSYVIQRANTRHLIQQAKEALSLDNVYLLGRFAEWEYSNMDKCIESAMMLADTFLPYQ